MEDRQPLTDREHAELLALYQATVTDLAFFKGQQWALTNYGLGVQAAAVAVVQLAKVPEVSPWRLVAIAAVTVAALVGWHFVGVVQRSIDERRNRLGRVYNVLSEVFKAARGSKPVGLDQGWHGPMLQGVLVGGAAVTSAVIWFV